MSSCKDFVETEILWHTQQQKTSQLVQKTKQKINSLIRMCVCVAQVLTKILLPRFKIIPPILIYKQTVTSLI